VIEVAAIDTITACMLSWQACLWAADDREQGLKARHRPVWPCCIRFGQLLLRMSTYAQPQSASSGSEQTSTEQPASSQHADSIVALKHSSIAQEVNIAQRVCDHQAEAVIMSREHMN
jgi:hypothetical protein